MDNISLIPYKGIVPKIHESVFLASGVKIIGDVEIAEDSSVWFNSVIRGDVNRITIGKMTNIQDLSVLHVTAKHPLILGDKITIGHAVKLHGCTIGDLCLIGIGAVVLDGAVIQKGSVIAAGAVVTPGFIVPSGKLVAGVPGKIVRDLSLQEIEELERSAVRYKEYANLSRIEA
ncbi:MAG: gamma carbonic anhydrase family protein [Ignavibacteriales bacterium]